MEIEEKQKLVNEVEFLLREYEATERRLHSIWKDEDDIKNEIMNRVLILTGKEEKLKKLNGLVGKRILITEEDMDVTIIKVEKIRLDKWEAVLKGDGVRICSGHVCKAYGHTIKIGRLDSELDHITEINTDDTYNKIVQTLNDSMELKKRETIEAIETKQKNTLDEFKLYYEGKKSDEDTLVALDKFRVDRLDDLTNISLGQLKKLAIGVEDPDERSEVDSLD